MNDKQKQLLEGIKKYQKRLTRRAMIARTISTVIVVALAGLVEWAFWNSVIVPITPFPPLPYLAVAVLVVVTYALIFFMADVVRKLSSRKDE